MCFWCRNSLFLFFIFFLSFSYSATCTAIVNNGNWCDASTWDCGHVPARGTFTADDVVIPAGITVVVNCQVNGGTGIIRINGSLIFNNGQGITMSSSPTGTIVLGPSASLSGGNGGSFLGIGTSGSSCEIYYGGSPGFNTAGPATCTFTSCCAPGALPVRILNYHTLQKEQNVHISWSTSSEINNDYFVIERSSDGINYQEIHKENGSLNSKSEKTYDALDYFPLEGTNYYRLKQVDLDGEFEYIGTSIVEFKASDFSFSLIPNPTNKNSSISFLTKNRTKVEIHVVDLTGKTLFYSTDYINEGFSSIVVPCDKWQAGTYLVYVKTNKEMLTEILIIN